MKFLRFKQCFFGLIFITNCVTISYSSQPLQIQFDNAKSDTARLNICTKLIKLYNITYKYDSCQLYIDKGLALAEKMKITIYHAEFYRSCVLLAIKQGRLTDCIKLLNKGRHWALLNNQANTVASIDYALATLYTNRALITNKRIDFKNVLAKIYNNIRFADKHHLLNTEAANYTLLVDFYRIYRNDSIAFKFIEKIVELKEKDEATAIKYEYKGKEIDKVLERSRVYVLMYRFQLSLFNKKLAQADAYLRESRARSIKSDIYYYGANVGPVEDYIRLGYFDEAIKISRVVRDNSRMMALMPIKDKFLFFCYLTSAYLAKHNYSAAKQAYQTSVLYAGYEKHSEFKIAKDLIIRHLQNKKDLLIYENHFQKALLVSNQLESLNDSINSNQTVFELAAGQE